MWDSVVAVARKEMLQIRRSNVVVRRVIGTQVFNFLMLAWLDVNVKNMPAVLVDQDHSVESRELVERVSATGTVKFKYVTTSTQQAREHIRAGRAKIALVVPPDYARRHGASETTQLLTLVDGSDPVSSAQAMTAISGVASRMNVEAREQNVEYAAVSAHEILLFNPQGKTALFTLPALLPLGVGMAYSINAMRRLLTERLGGQLERLLMTPVSHLGIIVGQLVPWFCLGLINIAGFLLAARLGFDLPIRGSLFQLFIAGGLFVATMLSIGSCIAAGADNFPNAMRTVVLLNVPALFLSGYVYPISAVPQLLLPISYALPHTHFIEIMRGICLRGATASDLAAHIAYLVCAPVFFSVWAAIRFARTSVA